jgi:hypothetical protein
MRGLAPQQRLPTCLPVLRLDERGDGDHRQVLVCRHLDEAVPEPRGRKPGDLEIDRHRRSDRIACSIQHAAGEEAVAQVASSMPASSRW